MVGNESEADAKDPWVSSRFSIWSNLIFYSVQHGSYKKMLVLVDACWKWRSIWLWQFWLIMIMQGQWGHVASEAVPRWWSMSSLCHCSAQVMSLSPLMSLWLSGHRPILRVFCVGTNQPCVGADSFRDVFELKFSGFIPGMFQTHPQRSHFPTTRQVQSLVVWN